MKIEQYMGVLVVLVIGLFVINASWPEATLANAQTSTAPACIPCCAPVNTWSVPATSGAGTPVTVQVPAKPASRAVAPAETPWEVLGAILEFPFVLGQCMIGGCPSQP